MLDDLLSQRFHLTRQILVSVELIYHYPIAKDFEAWLCYLVTSQFFRDIGGFPGIYLVKPYILANLLSRVQELFHHLLFTIVIANNHNFTVRIRHGAIELI